MKVEALTEKEGNFLKDIEPEIHMVVSWQKNKGWFRRRTVTVTKQYYSEYGIIWRNRNGRRVSLEMEWSLAEAYEAYKFRVKKYGHDLA